MTIAEPGGAGASRRVRPLRGQRRRCRSVGDPPALRSSGRKARGHLLGLVDQLPETLDIEFRGEIGSVDSKIAVIGVVKGLLTPHSDVPVSYVNALDLAAERGLEIRTISAPEARDHINVIRLSGGGHSLAGAVSEPDHDHGSPSSTTTCSRSGRVPTCSCCATPTRRGWSACGHRARRRRGEHLQHAHR